MDTQTAMWFHETANKTKKTQLDGRAQKDTQAVDLTVGDLIIILLLLQNRESGLQIRR
jgi:hypothetical protein